MTIVAGYSVIVVSTNSLGETESLACVELGVFARSVARCSRGATRIAQFSGAKGTRGNLELSSDPKGNTLDSKTTLLGTIKFSWISK